MPITSFLLYYPPPLGAFGASLVLRNPLGAPCGFAFLLRGEVFPKDSEFCENYFPIAFDVMSLDSFRYRSA